MRAQTTHEEKVAEVSMRFAFYGRVSTEDNQDPTLSLPRQLANCERAVAEAGGRVVAHFYDVESGAMRLDQRGLGKGLVGFDIPIPRDGGPLRSDRGGLVARVRRGRVRVDQPAEPQPVGDLPRRGAVG